MLRRDHRRKGHQVVGHVVCEEVGILFRHDRVRAGRETFDQGAEHASLNGDPTFLFGARWPPEDAHGDTLVTPATCGSIERAFLVWTERAIRFRDGSDSGGLTRREMSTAPLHLRERAPSAPCECVHSLEFRPFAMRELAVRVMPHRAHSPPTVAPRSLPASPSRPTDTATKIMTPTIHHRNRVWATLFAPSRLRGLSVTGQASHQQSPPEQSPFTHIATSATARLAPKWTFDAGSEHQPK